MEVPQEENWTVLKRAAETGARVILNMAPAMKIPHDVLTHVDILIVNRIEGEQIANALGLDIDDNSKILAQSLAREGNLTCIMTLSDQGSIAATPEGKGWTCEAFTEIDVLDTTGAGDTYCGVFAAAIHEGMTFPEAMKRASVAASLACRAVGAQSSMPHEDEVLEYLPSIAEPEHFDE